jgi:hypothetical protein
MRITKTEIFSAVILFLPFFLVLWYLLCEIIGNQLDSFYSLHRWYVFTTCAVVTEGYR